MNEHHAEPRRLVELATAVRESSLKRLRAVPEACENWRPASGAMSFSDVARHLIDCDEWLFHKLRDPSLKGIDGLAGSGTVASRSEYLALLGSLVEVGERRAAFLAELTEDDLAAEVYDDRFGDEVSVWWVIVRGNLDHEAHHRGQLAAYLRILEESSERP